MKFFAKFIENMQTDLSTDYVRTSVCISLATGLVLFAVCLIIALRHKQIRTHGIINAVLQIAFTMCSCWYVISFHRSELHLIINEEPKNILGAIANFLGFGTFEMYVSMIPVLIAGVICFVAWLSNIIYINTIKYECNTLLSKVAIGLQVVRLVLVNPVPMFFAFKSGGITEALQSKYTLIFYGVCLLPCLIMLLASLIGFRENKKDEYATDDNVVVIIDGEEKF